jgi:5-methylcytosine-specific restriction protein A
MDILPFIPDHIYNRRRDIHGRYGGNWQSGISTSATHPYIFIFTGKAGAQHGYADRWENQNVFSYTGEGQSGDMEFTRGNLALREHLNQGKRVFLFEQAGKGFAKFIAEVEIHEIGFFETHDSNKNIRTGIKFFFKRKGLYIPKTDFLQEFNYADQPPQELYKMLQPNVTERKGLVTSRVGQGAFRSSIIHRWEYQCAVTSFNKLDILIASHIVPWVEANNDERLNVHNGILLSPVYDALFDRHLISFEDRGNIILSEQIEARAFEQIGVSGKERILNFSAENHAFLERHRNRMLGV